MGTRCSPAGPMAMAREELQEVNPIVNRLLEIENELGSSALWQGKAAYTGWRNRE